MKQFIDCLSLIQIFPSSFVHISIIGKKRWTDVLNFEKEERRMLTSLKIVL